MGIEIGRAAGRYRVHLGTLVLGESEAALSLQEPGRAAVIYVPRADMDQSLLVPSARITHCPHKGAARHYGIVTPQGTRDNLVWSYEDPKPGCEAIAGHLAFYPGVTVEKVG